MRNREGRRRRRKTRVHRYSKEHQTLSVFPDTSIFHIHWVDHQNFRERSNQIEFFENAATKCSIKSRVQKTTWSALSESRRDLDSEPRQEGWKTLAFPLDRSLRSQLEEALLLPDPIFQECFPELPFNSQPSLSLKPHLPIPKPAPNPDPVKAQQWGDLIDEWDWSRVKARKIVGRSDGIRWGMRQINLQKERERERERWDCFILGKNEGKSREHSHSSITLSLSVLSPQWRSFSVMLGRVINRAAGEKTKQDNGVFSAGFSGSQVL